MNPKNLSIRMDGNTGALFLTEEKYRTPIRRIADLTSPILMALCADLVSEDGTKQVSRDIKFSDGFAARLTIEDITHVQVAGEIIGNPHTTLLDLQGTN